MWVLPSTHRTTQAQCCSRGAVVELGDGVYPATVRAGGSRAATPTGPPTTHCWAAGSWARSQGGGRAGGAAALGSAKATGPRSQSGERKPAGKKQNSPRRKPKLISQPDVSPVLEGPRATGRGRGTAGRQAGRKDAAIRPGLEHCQDNDPGLGPASACLVLGRQGDRGVVWFGTSWPKAADWGDPSLVPPALYGCAVGVPQFPLRRLPGQGVGQGPNVALSAWCWGFYVFPLV